LRENKLTPSTAEPGRSGKGKERIQPAAHLVYFISGRRRREILKKKRAQSSWSLDSEKRKITR